MIWSRLRKMAISLPAALLAVVLLVGIYETGYMRSHDAVGDLARSHATRTALDRLLQNMLNAETGLRGYLLTGDDRYLQPYNEAVATINSNLDELRQTYQRLPQDQADFAQLSQQIARKLSELDLSLNLRRQNNDDAWKFVLSTDVGKDNMDAIRAIAARLVERSAQQAQGSTQEILHSLMLSRIGIATVAVIGLLAFYMYLRQTNALQEANEREQEVLARERDRLEQLVRERTASLSALANHLQQVREDERDWEGAAERLLHGFGLSLLVPDVHYKDVADWVERQHLGARLVYFHVRARTSAQAVSLHPQSLVRKLLIKPDTPHYDWLERELHHRFDLACCDTQRAVPPGDARHHPRRTDQGFHGDR